MARGAKRACVLVACAAGALATLLGDAEAQTNRNGRTVAQIERDRRAETTRAERLRQQANAARAEVRALDQRLVESGRRRAEAEAAAAAAEARLTELQAQITADSLARQNARRGLESALIAAAFAERRADQRAVRAGIFARAVAPTFARAERSRGQALAEARASEDNVRQEQRVLADAQAAIDAERAELVTLTARRRTAQVAFARDATAAEQRARTLASEARNLRELTQRASATARRSAPAAGGGASVIPTAWVAPAEGRISLGFGVREGSAPATQGATLRTRSGAQVVSPAAGEVAYAGVFRSYGQVLILNLEGGYALVLTGLDRVSVRVGDTVQTGQPVGEMPNSDMTAPELYVEVRRGGQPIDPGRWLNARGVVAERGVRAG